MKMTKEWTVKYLAVKNNKCDIQYQSEVTIPSGCFLTDRVKVESFQGYSKAYNLGEYFRLRGETSWKTGEQVTGLWRTESKNIFYGDRRTKKGKTLILFQFQDNRKILNVHHYPEGFYPDKSQIESIASNSI